MRPPVSASHPRRRPRLRPTVLALVVVAFLAATLTAPAGASGDGLRVSVSADSQSQVTGDTTVVSAEVENAPAGESAQYRWDVCSAVTCVSLTQHTVSFWWDTPMVWSFQVTVSYESGASATSEQISIAWADPETESDPDPEAAPEAEAAPTPTTAPEAAAEPAVPSVTAVAVSSDAGGDGTYIAGDTIEVTATFSEAVVVSGTPRLKIDMDPAFWGEKSAAYAGGSGTNRLTFAHEVVEPNFSSQGIAVLADSLELNGGTITSAASQAAAVLSHGGLGHDGGHKVDWQQSPPAPTVAAVAVTSDAGSDDTYIAGDTIRVSVAFSEAVDVTGTPQLSIDMDPALWGEKRAAYAGGSGTNLLTFAHEVVEPNLSSQGIAVLADTLELDGGTIKSAASQTAADLSHAGLAHDGAHKVDWQQSPPPRPVTADNECGRAVPAAVTSLGVPLAMVVSWQIPDAPESCEPTGFTIFATGNGGVELRVELPDAAATTHTIGGLDPDDYQVTVWARYAQGASTPVTAYATVPPECDVTLTLTLTLTGNAGYEVTGTWTNAAANYGCESGGVHVMWKKTADTPWNQVRVPNQNNDINRQFIWGGLDADPYQFKVRTVDAAGTQRESNTAAITIPGGPTGIKATNISNGNATITWTALTGAGTVTGHTVRYRKWDAGEGVDNAWVTDTSSLAANITTHTIDGLDHYQVYSVQVGARIGTNTLWSKPARFRAVDDPLVIWLGDATPNFNADIKRLFVFTDTNHNASASGACFINGGRINCPARTLVSFDAVRSGSYRLEIVGTAPGKTTGRFYVSGDHNGVTMPFLILVSGGSREFAVRWEPNTTTHNGWAIETRHWNGSAWTGWATEAIVGKDVREYKAEVRYAGVDDNGDYTPPHIIHNTNYEVRVRGRNMCDHDGDSNTPNQTCFGMSREVPVTTAAGKTKLPSHVVNATVAAAGFETGVGGKLKVEWDPPWWGNEVYGYTVSYRPAGTTGTWTEKHHYSRIMHRNNGANPRSVTLTGLTGGTSYEIRVEAFNVNGKSDWVTLAATAPSS